MARKYPTDIIEQSIQVLEGWRQISSPLTVDGAGADDLQTELNNALPLKNQMANLEAQMTTLRNERDAIYQRLWTRVKRVRQAVKGVYGDDSNEYELVGGTRASERVPYTRQPLPPESAP